MMMMMNNKMQAVRIFVYQYCVLLLLCRRPLEVFSFGGSGTTTGHRQRKFGSISRSSITRTSVLVSNDDFEGEGSTSVVSSIPSATTDILICGGGPTGLLASIMLAQKFPKSQIQVHDRLPVPPDPTDDQVWGDTSKYYLIGLGGRGITSLETFGVWNEDDGGVAPFCLSVPGRKDWTPETPEGKETIRTDRKYVTQVLPRDKLVSILHRHVVQNYSEQIELVYQSQVRPVEFEYHHHDRHRLSDNTSDNPDTLLVPQVLVEVSHVDENDWKPILADLVIASDGSARTFANCMEELDQGVMGDPFQVVRFEDDNVRVYKTLPFRLPERSWSIRSSPTSHDESQGDIFWNYAVQSAKRRVIFDALPANHQGDYVGVLLLRGDDEMAQPNVDPALFRDFLEQEIPQFISLLGDEAISAAAKSGPSSLPQFRYITPRMYQGPRTILLGDTAHTVKPYFGMGANSALEDVKVRFENDETDDGFILRVHQKKQRHSPFAFRRSLVNASMNRLII